MKNVNFSCVKLKKHELHGVHLRPRPR